MKALRVIALAAVIVFAFSTVRAENIDPRDEGHRYAWGENVGWLNFKPSHGPGVQVSSEKVEGFAWAENIGWINLSPAAYGGVTNNRNGNLSGYAWGENVGWINFDPGNGGVTVDPLGNFEGWAWGENIGWIRFDSTKTYNVQACVVSLEDMANLASQWIKPIDNKDFGDFAQYWLDYCPDGWDWK